MFSGLLRSRSTSRPARGTGHFRPYFLVFFHAVIVVPPLSTWSRARHAGKGQWPLRSRAHPCGLHSLSAADRGRVLQANQVLEITSLACFVTLHSVKHTNLLLMMPEDFGVRWVWRRATIWLLIWVTSPFVKVQRVILNLLSLQQTFRFFFRSVLGEAYWKTPMVLPIREHLDHIERMLVAGCLHWSWMSAAWIGSHRVLQRLQGCSLRA